MSSNISQRMSQEIESEVVQLLGRGRQAFLCPLSKAQRKELWDTMLGDETLQAIRVLEQKGYDVSFHQYHTVDMTTEIEGEKYVINFWNWEDDGDGEMRSHAFIKAGGDDGGDRTPEQVRVAFPKDADWSQFVQWVQNTGRIEYESEAAIQTIGKLLEFCNTIGQLTRAVPELAQYLSKEKREILQGQKRASNMPFEWSTFDRSRIDTLQFALAKAHLMPKGSGRPWGEIHASHATKVVTE